MLIRFTLDLDPTDLDAIRSHLELPAAVSDDAALSWAIREAANWARAYDAAKAAGVSGA